jgi:4-amino-4-deoxy-L-arabinose transferase-like glycosyltransferase
LLVLCWLAFFNGLGALGLMDKTEALFVEVGRQMLTRNDWVTPWWNGEHFFDYPVWGYWMVALSFRLFGISPWAARLPVAVAATAVVVAAFFLFLHWGDPRERPGRRWGRAAAAAGVLATAPGWIGWGRTSTTDMFLSSAISLALLSFLLAHYDPPRSRTAIAGRMGLALFCGVAVLAKGPVGVVLPLLVVTIFLVLSGEWRPWLHPFRLAAMLALFLAVCLPWYAAATRVNGAAFLGGFLGFSNLQRFTQVLYDHPGPPWFYLPWLVILLLPWSLFLPGAIVRLRFWRWTRWRHRATPPSPGTNAGLFLLLWLAIPLAFFSLAATKLPGYILPIVPAAALLVSLSFWPLPAEPLADGPSSGAADRWQRGAAWLEAGLLALMAVAAALAPRWVATDPAHPTFGAALAGSGLPDLFAILLVLTSLCLGIALIRTSEGPWLWLTNLTGFLAILALVIAPLGPVIDRERLWPIRQLARQARDQARPDEPLWVVGTKRYSVLFYGGETAAFVSGRESLEDRLKKDPGSLRLLPTSQTARLFGDRRHLEDLEWPAASVRRLARIGQQEIWRVRLPDATRQEPL